jgi:hypothetical protein
MAGVIYNGNPVNGLIYNGNPISLYYNGERIWPAEDPIQQYSAVRFEVGWNKQDNLTFDGMWLNGLRADFPDDCYAGQYYNGSWHPINSSEMSAICREGQGTAGTAFYCNSARFMFSGNRPQGWRNIAWTTQQYYQPAGTVTAAAYGRTSPNYERFLGSATFNITNSATYTLNLS